MGLSEIVMQLSGSAMHNEGNDDERFASPYA